jgi:transcriptional regulator with XRE-family HTH domain
MFIGSSPSRLSELPKSIYADRHRKLCELLKVQRKTAGLTQTVVAKRLAKPPSYVAKYEGGERRLDLLEYLDIADAIGFDPCELIRILKNNTRRPLCRARDNLARRRSAK